MAILLAFTAAIISTVPTNPGVYRVQVQVDGRLREYRLHLPPCYDHSTSLPVILAFHGMSANSRLLQRWTQLDKAADKHGFITVCPEGTGIGPLKGFKAGGSTRRRENRKPDDVAFVRAVLDDLERDYSVDRRRVYATGLSNGAMLCYRLAVEMPERIAAIAPVSGALGTEVCMPRYPISIMHFHGTADDVLPFCGPRANALFPQSYHAVTNTLQYFADVARCVSPPQVTAVLDECQDGTSLYIHSYNGCMPGIELKLIEIRGGGHQWPGRPLPLRYLGQGTMEVDANEMICCFFKRHALKH